VDGSQNDAFGDLALTANLARITQRSEMTRSLTTRSAMEHGRGREAGDTIIDGNDNVCIGHFAGAGIVDASKQHSNRGFKLQALLPTRITPAGSAASMAGPLRTPAAPWP